MQQRAAAEAIFSQGRGGGLVRARVAAINAEFGPTAEPLTGTNVIGKVLDAGSLAKMREGTTVYVREVK